MAALSPLDSFLFDTQGYIVVPQVFSAEEVARVNAATDAHAASFRERTGALRLGGTSASMAGDGVTGREDLGGILGWKVDGATNPLRDLLTHPRLQPYFNALCGRGYRLDHSPFILQQRRGADGFVMHGGALDDSGQHDFELSYQCHGGRMRCMLLAASLQLTDTHAGEGGFCIIPGSHKAAFPCPVTVKEHKEAQQYVVQPVTRAGDVVLFTEACTHGTLAWQGERTRRLALYRFAPANAAYGRAYLRGDETWPAEYTEGMTEAQRAVMAAPFHTRLDREAPAVDGVHVTVPEPRAGFKKGFDKSVFGTQYF